MSRHTPGPWVAKPIREDARGFRVREIHHGSDVTSGGVHVEVHELGNEGSLNRLDADARLIAEAPLLLGALYEAVAYYIDNESDDPRARRLRVRAMEVIDRVEGKR